MTWCNKILVFIIYLIKFQLTFMYHFSMHYICYGLHFLHCTWLRCIRSCTEDPSHRFLANKWLVHNRFMGLVNPLKAIVHHLLIGGMAGLGYWDRFPMVSALVCMVAHWIGPMVSYDLRLSSSHNFTKLLHCEYSLNLERILSLCWS